MKHFIAFLVGLGMLSTSLVHAQIDCASAAPFCTDFGVTYPAGVGNGDAPAGPDYDCLFTTPNPAWFYLNISQSGDINITLTNSNLIDVDFILWGPFANQSQMCTSIFNQTAGIEDCSYLTDATEYIDLTGAVVGEWYMLLITNYADAPTDIIATQTGGGGATNCDILCNVDNFTANIGLCDSPTQTYPITGTVTVSGAPTTGTMTVSSSCGGTPAVFNAPFATTTSYTVSGIPTTGGPCTIDVTFSDNPFCTSTINYTSPQCAPCNIDYFEANIGVCDPNTNGYPVSGVVQTSNVPTTGQLIVESCYGNQAVFNAPFPATINYNLTGLWADGQACDVTVYFTANPSCTNTIPYTAPAACGCGAQAGTYAPITTGNTNTPTVLCFNDSFAITTNGDYVLPPNVNDATIAYNPGIWYLVMSCPPTTAPGDSIENDPCLVSVVSSDAVSDINDLAFINSFPAGTFTNNTIYLVPITMYDVTTGYYTVTNYNGVCYDLGPVMPYTYLPEVIAGTETANCQAQTLSVPFSGGAPELFGTNFTASNLSPSTAFFVTSTISNGGSIVVGGLLDGDMVSFTVEDQYGCPYDYSYGPFTGPAIPTVTPAGPFCVADPAVQLQATPAGGTWSGPGVSPSGMFTPSAAGVGTATVSYLPAGCALSESIDIVITGFANATIAALPAFCLDDSPLFLTAATPGGTWSGTGITNTTTGVFDPSVAGVGTFTITYTIAGNCGDTDTQTFTVNPLPIVSFTADAATGCTPFAVNFTNTSPSVGTGCTWWIDGVPSGNSCTSFSNVFETAGCFDIGLTTYDGNGCSSSVTIPDMVCAVQPPVADFSFSPTQPSVNNSIVTFQNLSLGATSYLWTINSSSFFTEPNPVFFFPNEEAGDYPVCLLVSNDLGCTDLLCATVHVSDELVVYVPNSFTPTGDNINDVFKPSIKGISLIAHYEFMIFNRWGELIFESNNPEEPWIGNVRGGAYFAQDGVYAWKMKIRPNNGQEAIELDGHVTIVR